MKKIIAVHKEDNVATAMDDLEAGKHYSIDIFGEEKSIQVRSSIMFGHKVAIRPIKTGDLVYKYGQPIGKASSDIMIGDHVHISNVVSQRARKDHS